MAKYAVYTRSEEWNKNNNYPADGSYEERLEFDTYEDVDMYLEHYNPTIVGFLTNNNAFKVCEIAEDGTEKAFEFAKWTGQ